MLQDWADGVPTTPDLILLGQVTVDDVVPATAGRWQRQLGGSSLYALAGARLWLAPERIGLVARVGADFPFELRTLLQQAGVSHLALSRFEAEHLVEWLIYEADGSRRSLPRNASLRDIGAEGGVTGEGYLQKLLQIAPTAADIPASWLPCRAVHLCPQVGTRHRDSLAALKGRVGWISVDPSPHYSRSASVLELGSLLQGATAFLPSEQEVRSLLTQSTPEALAAALHSTGFAEVVIKRGGEPAVLAGLDGLRQIPAQVTAVVDPTGAGDAFCGAFAACRLLGHSPDAAARRAMATAARVVACRGVEQALALQPIAPAETASLPAR